MCVPEDAGGLVELGDVTQGCWDVAVWRGFLAGVPSAAGGGGRAPWRGSGARGAEEMGQGGAQHVREENEQVREERSVLFTR